MQTLNSRKAINFDLNNNLLKKYYSFKKLQKCLERYKEVFTL